MKKLVSIMTIAFSVLFFTACEKQNLNTNNDQSDYYLTKKGQKKTNLEVHIYKVNENDDGNCTGYFLSPTDTKFNYLIEVVDGIPESILNNSDMETMSSILDIEYLGIAYNCNQSFKKPTSGKSSPVEIQQVKVTKIEVK
jgi:hypothetical protein